MIKIDHLSKKFGKGFSITNLKQMRQFYLTYRDDQISQKVSDQFKNLPVEAVEESFSLVGHIT